MILERRDFLKLVGAAVGGACLGSCDRLRVPDRLVELALRGPGVETSLNTVCRLCEGGCGLTVRLVDGLPVGLKGNPRHPLNRGGLCPVGQSALEVLYAPERLQGPLRKRSDGDFEPVSWDDALDEIGDRLGALVAESAGERFALWSGETGSLLTDLGRRFAAALGSPNLFLEPASPALPFLLSQGLERVPGFDLANADVVLSVGLDLFEDGPAPLNAVSSLIGSRETADRARLLHIGTRVSPTASKAEEYVAVRADAHAAAALGIAHVLVREGRYDHRFVAEHTFGFDDWTDDRGEPRLGLRRLLLERYYPDRAAALAGCEPGQLIRMARRLAAAEAPLAVWGGEAIAGTHATYTALAVHSLNALLGAFGRPGGVVLPPPIPFSPLATIAAGPAPSGSGAASTDLLDGLASGRIELLFLLAANPLYDHPAAAELAAALAKVPLVVAFSPFRDETAEAADLILPPSFFLEDWEESTTPAGVAISVLGVTQPVVEPFFATRHPGDVLLELARRAGDAAATALPWTTYRDYLEDRLEGLTVSGRGSVISGSFEESWIHYLEERGWRFLEQDDRGAFWRDLVREGGWWSPVAEPRDWERLFAGKTGRYEFFSLELERRLRQAGRARTDAEASDAEALARGVEALGLEVPADVACLPHFETASEEEAGGLALVPFRPITARGRLGVTSPMILEMYGYAVLSGWQTWAELAPETAHELHVEEGDRVELSSPAGALEAVVRVEPGATPGCVHLPLGLGRQGAVGPATGVGANPLRLAGDARDPISGAPATAGTRVGLRLVRRRRRGGVRPLSGGH